MTGHAKITEEHILAILTGTPSSLVAAHTGLHSQDLDEAVAAYRAGGQAILAATQAHGDRWFHASVEFPRWDYAEHLAGQHLRPALTVLTEAGHVASWWYVRKAPCWRFRFHTTDIRAGKRVSESLDELAGRGVIAAWRPGHYEPETLAFGGATGMHVAHQLFHTDSQAILGYICEPSPVRRRELSLLLCTMLLRAARLDWFEQGDVWHHVTRLRPLPADIRSERLNSITRAVRWLLTADTDAAFADPSPLGQVRSWADAFASAGQRLRRGADNGTLDRGIRSVLAHHIIFHWNRLGIATTDQAILSHAAVTAIIHEQP